MHVAVDPKQVAHGEEQGEHTLAVPFEVATVPGGHTLKHVLL